MAASGLIIGAPRSGSGKTTLTLAMLGALRRRGLHVRAAKSGPDYIDPSFHAVATDASCPNLDSWAMAPAQLDSVIADVAGDAELVLIESAMGLFDGVEAEPGRSGAAADLAARYRMPVLLILDVSGQSQSAAAVARGFMQHDPAVRIGGVILNRVASDRHRDGIVRALGPLDLPVLGSLPRDASIALAERHLGLVSPAEYRSLDDLLTRLSDLAEEHLDLNAILAMATSIGTYATDTPMLAPPGQRIAVASDAAFSFIYPHLMHGWRAAGADIILFSPLADEFPPEECDACWLPGGYPELHGAQLAAASRFRSGITEYAETRPVHGECGGYMVLGKTLEDASSQQHQMLGLLSHATSFARRRLHLGYRRAVLLGDCALGRAGSSVRGHEFHYSTTIDPGTDRPLASLADARARPLEQTGGRRGNVSGSFFHAIAAEPAAGVHR